MTENETDKNCAVGNAYSMFAVHRFAKKPIEIEIKRAGASNSKSYSISILMYFQFVLHIVASSLLFHKTFTLHNL